MRRKSLAAILAALSLTVLGLSTEATGAADDTEHEPPPRLQRDGRWLVDPHGRVVLVHGVNLVWKHAPYVPPDSAEGFTTADAEWLADHGFNGARIGTLWAGVQPTGPHGVDTAYLAKWQRIIDDLAERRIWIQFDFHQDQWNETYLGAGMPAWAVRRPLPYSLLPPVNAPFPLGYWTPELSTVFDNFWADKDGLQTAWAQAWRAVAGHWKDQPYSMGYDLMNEPWPGLEWADCLLTGCLPTYARELQPAMDKARSAIRQVDDAGLVWYEPQQFAGGRASPTAYVAVPGEEQLGYSWHNYCPEVFFESQGVPGQDVENCAAYSEKITAMALDQGERMQAVGLMSEFAATDNVRAIEIDTAVADTHLTSWMHWAYKGWGDLATADPAQGLFHDDADLTTTKPKVRTLVRTYPQATCGTPGELSFDPTSGAFHYTFTAGSCNGRPTEIFVSPLHYPQGYDLDVEGGILAGTASHHRVLVRARAGQEVTVTIEARR